MPSPSSPSCSFSLEAWRVCRRLGLGVVSAEEPRLPELGSSKGDSPLIAFTGLSPLTVLKQKQNTIQHNKANRWRKPIARPTPPTTFILLSYEWLRPARLLHPRMFMTSIGFFVFISWPQFGDGNLQHDVGTRLSTPWNRNEDHGWVKSFYHNLKDGRKPFCRPNL